MLAGDIAVVDDRPAKGRQGKAGHDDVHRDDDAEKGDEDHRRMPPGKALLHRLVGHGAVPGRSNWMVPLSPRGSLSSGRSEERSVGKECVRTSKSRWARCHLNKQKNITYTN